MRATDPAKGRDVSRRGVVVWFTGLPSSGKSKLARAVRADIVSRGPACVLLDGDAVRDAIVPRPGYTAEDRAAFYATLGRFAALLSDQGLVVLVAATAHQEAYRSLARELTTAFIEVLVDTPREVCEARDSKGLYAKVRAGQLSGVPGADLPFERPENPDVVAQGGVDEVAVAKIVQLLAESRESPFALAFDPPAPPGAEWRTP